MAENLIASESGISSAISNIRTKAQDLETQANSVSNAFTEVTETVKLVWLDNMITEDWNTTGSAIVDNAKETLAGLMKDLEDTAKSASELSQGL